MFGNELYPPFSKLYYITYVLIFRERREPEYLEENPRSIGESNYENSLT